MEFSAQLNKQSAPIEPFNGHNKRITNTIGRHQHDHHTFCGIDHERCSNNDLAAAIDHIIVVCVITRINAGLMEQTHSALLHTPRRATRHDSRGTLAR